MANPELFPLAARGEIVAILAQNALQELLKPLDPWRWEVDLLESRLSFVNESDDTKRRDTTIELIGSVAPGPRSTLWGWAHPQGSETGAAALIRDSGAPGLDQPELAFSADYDGSDVENWIAEQAHRLGQAAVAVAGNRAYYSAPTGGGSRAVFLLDVDLPRVSVADFLGHVMTILSSGLLDARTAIWFAAQTYGWNVEWTAEDYSAATMSDDSGSMKLTFDEAGRVTGLEASYPGAAPEAE